MFNDMNFKKFNFDVLYNKIVSGMVHDSCDPEIVCSDPDLSEIRGSSLVSTSQSGTGTILAASSSISSRCFYPFDTSI